MFGLTVVLNAAAAAAGMPGGSLKSFLLVKS